MKDLGTHGRPSNAPRLKTAGGVASFNVDEFTRAIDGMGTSFRWSRAYPCPCTLNDDTGQWDPTCDRCLGDGWAYINPLRRLERHHSRDFTPMDALFSQGDIKPTLYEPYGPWFNGEAQMTVAGDHMVGYRDRFISMSQRMAWAELLTYDSVRAVKVGRGGRSTESRLASMRYEPIEVLYVRDDDTEYYEGTDFTLRGGTESGNDPEPMRFEWIEGRAPADGTEYAVSYVCRPVWIVDSAVYEVQHLQGPERGSSGTFVTQKLPKTFKVRLDYLVTDGRGS